MTISQAYRQLQYQLSEIYDERESSNIANLVIEHITGFTKATRIMNKNIPLSENQQALYADYANQLLKHKPVQYVLQESWFAGMKFYVNEDVLIPRPETEELVQWITTDYERYKIAGQPLLILDIGTGSGCIAVALKKKLHHAEITAIDISEKALTVAAKNAAVNNTPATFIQQDITQKNTWGLLPQFTIIASNPPYITKSEAAEMQAHVTNYEPHEALFVPDDNAMLFYTVITEFAMAHLQPDGKLYFEIHEQAAEKVCSILSQNNFTGITVKKDMQGKNRMVRAALHA